MTALRDRLQSGRPLLFDGAMGTYFAARYGEGRCELADLDRSEAVRAIHRAYLDAGCEAIRTNTFSVSADLAGGEEDLSRSLIQAGCRLALETAAPYGAYVFADIGPAPEGKALDRGAVYSRQAELFLDQGITCFLAETLPSDEGIADLAAELKARCPEAFLLVSFAVGHDGVTREGLAGGELLRRTAAIPGVDAVGFNCVSGPQHLLEYIQTLDLTGITLSVMPNAGYPTVLGRRIAFQGTPTYFGQKISQIGAAGAAIVGGCCGTTPDHIARAAEALARPPV
ncbi:MAG: homocysteine S-methyltransferase family protein, partial [Oscillibacter sp.]|nr:homocysteine S-methyltransferase family protein [Oscillibacter sp.]